MGLKYEQKFVAFIDLLGFREAVKNKKIEEIFVALDINSGQLEFQQKMRERWIGNKGFYNQVFSDSVYLVYPEERGWDLLHDVASLMLCMAAQGFYFRGGIDFGEVFCDENILFGPAVINAYEIESNVAIYPRTVISHIALNRLRLMADEQEFCDGIAIDKDGCSYVDFFKEDRKLFLNVSRIYTGLKGNIKKLRKCRHINAAVLSKITWLCNYYNDRVDWINANRVFGEGVKFGITSDKPFKKIRI